MNYPQSMLTTISEHKLKFDKWWIYKIGSGVFTWLLFKFLFSTQSFVASVNCNDLALLILLVGLAVQGHLLNDWGDVGADRLTGKTNILSQLAKRYQFWIVAGVTLLNLSLAYSFFSLPIFALSIAQTILNILYSLPPTRIKERGIISILITGLQERALPYTLIIIYILDQSVSVWFTCCYITWAFVWECRNYIAGQLADEQNDKVSGVKSIVTIYGSEACYGWIRMLSFFEVAFFISWVTMFMLSNSSAIFFAPLIVLFSTMYLLLNRINNFSAVLNGLDYTYNHALLGAACTTSILLNSSQNYWLAAWLIIFPNKVLWAFTTTLFLHIKTALVRMYYIVRKPASLIVNYSIYYFRLYVLRWPESKSRGEDK